MDGISPTGKERYNAEEGWTLIPDGSVLTVDVKGTPNPNAISLQTGEWVSRAAQSKSAAVRRIAAANASSTGKDKML